MRKSQPHYLIYTPRIVLLGGSFLWWTALNLNEYFILSFRKWYEFSQPTPKLCYKFVKKKKKNIYIRASNVY